MHAMQLDAVGQRLHMVERLLPEPGPGEIRVAVSACGVCRTDLHVVDGDIHGPLPIVQATRSSAGSMRSVPA